MIRICTDHLILSTLKECLGHFRNLCQYTDRDKLENVLNIFRERAVALMKNLVEKYGEAKIKSVFTDDIQDHTEEDPQQLLFLSFCDFESVEAREQILPVVLYVIDVLKVILDILRQNSKMLDFYNQTAIMCFDYICQFNCKKEHKKLSETLHSHFKQILVSSKASPDATKIPFPVILDEDETLKKVLTMRTSQLDYAL
jgi:hypothetical protein